MDNEQTVQKVTKMMRVYRAESAATAGSAQALTGQEAKVVMEMIAFLKDALVTLNGPPPTKEDIGVTRTNLEIVNQVQLLESTEEQRMLLQADMASLVSIKEERDMLSGKVGVSLESNGWKALHWIMAYGVGHIFTNAAGISVKILGVEMFLRAGTYGVCVYENWKDPAAFVGTLFQGGVCRLQMLHSLFSVWAGLKKVINCVEGELCCRSFTGETGDIMVKIAEVEHTRDEDAGGFLNLLSPQQRIISSTDLPIAARNISDELSQYARTFTFLASHMSCALGAGRAFLTACASRMAKCQKM
jgi:hypothetical protein